jgi:hypothetical protein
LSEEIPFRIPEIPAKYHFWGAILLYPCFLSEDRGARCEMALETVVDLWKKAHFHARREIWEEQELDRKREIKRWRATFKKLLQPVEENDEHTVQGYLKIKYKRSYKTTKNLRDMLVRKGIQILQGRELGEKSFFDVVRTADLDKIGEMMRTKERERKKSIRTNRKGAKKILSGTRWLLHRAMSLPR